MSNLASQGLLTGGVPMLAARHATQLIQMFWYGNGNGIDFYVESGRPL